MSRVEMICAVVNMGHGSKALRIAKQYGVRGGTICLGMGTVSSRILDFLELTDIRKEVLFMVAEEEVAKVAMRGLNEDLHLKKPNHGIVFSFSLSGFIASKLNKRLDTERDITVNHMSYRVIFTVVDKGLGMDAVDAAKSAGARGATIISARGSGIHDTDKVFAMDIEPEREMVMILVKTDIAAAVLEAINQKMGIDEPGNGVMFTVDVNEAFGLA